MLKYAIKAINIIVIIIIINCWQTNYPTGPLNITQKCSLNILPTKGELNCGIKQSTFYNRYDNCISH